MFVVATHARWLLPTLLSGEILAYFGRYFFVFDVPIDTSVFNIVYFPVNIFRVPCYVFNEHRTYANIQGQYSFRFWLNTLGLPAILPWGQWWCPLLPNSQVDLHVVVGTSIRLPTIVAPTRKEVNEFHKKYVNEVIMLYERHQGRFGIEEQLEVWN